MITEDLIQIIIASGVVALFFVLGILVTFLVQNLEHLAYALKNWSKRP